MLCTRWIFPLPMRSSPQSSYSSIIGSFAAPPCHNGIIITIGGAAQGRNDGFQIAFDTGFGNNGVAKGNIAITTMVWFSSSR